MRIKPSWILHGLALDLVLSAASFTATPARADQISPYPCSQKIVNGGDFCSSVWDKTKDSTWMVFMVEFSKKPAPESLETPDAISRLRMCNGIFFNAYQVRSAANPDQLLTMPAPADQKWSYGPLVFRRYYVQTISLDDIIGKLTYVSPTAIGPRNAASALSPARPAMGAEAFLADGRKVGSRTKKAHGTEMMKAPRTTR